MGMVEVVWPTGVAIPGRVAVERFAVLVSAVEAGVGCLQPGRYLTIKYDVFNYGKFNCELYLLIK